MSLQSATCMQCPVGYSQPVPGSPTCVPCAPGYYAGSGECGEKGDTYMSDTGCYAGCSEREMGCEGADIRRGGWRWKLVGADYSGGESRQSHWCGRYTNLNPPTCSWQRHLHPMPHRPDLSPGRLLLRQLPGRLLCRHAVLGDLPLLPGGLLSALTGDVYVPALPGRLLLLYKRHKGGSRSGVCRGG